MRRLNIVELSWDIPFIILVFLMYKGGGFIRHIEIRSLLLLYIINTSILWYFGVVYNDFFARRGRFIKNFVFYIMAMITFSLYIIVPTFMRFKESLTVRVILGIVSFFIGIGLSMGESNKVKRENRMSNFMVSLLFVLIALSVYQGIVVGRRYNIVYGIILSLILILIVILSLSLMHWFGVKIKGYLLKRNLKDRYHTLLREVLFSSLISIFMFIISYSLYLNTNDYIWNIKIKGLSLLITGTVGIRLILTLTKKFNIFNAFIGILTLTLYILYL